jgi:hypothetical protein
LNGENVPYKRKQTKWAKKELARVKRTKSIAMNLTLIKTSWFEKYLKDDGYAEWYDNWCDGFKK